MEGMLPKRLSVTKTSENKPKKSEKNRGRSPKIARRRSPKINRILGIELELACARGLKGQCHLFLV